MPRKRLAAPEGTAEQQKAHRKALRATKNPPKIQGGCSDMVMNAMCVRDDQDLANVVNTAIDAFRMWQLVTPADKWKTPCGDCDHDVGFTCEQCSLDGDMAKLGRMLYQGGFIK